MKIELPDFMVQDLEELADGTGFDIQGLAVSLLVCKVYEVKVGMPPRSLRRWFDCARSRHGSPQPFGELKE